MPDLRSLLRLLVVLAALAGLVGAAFRYRTEVNNRRVELVLDMTEIQKIAAAEGMTTAQTLQAFKAAGATSIALTEDTLKSLTDNQRLEIVSTPKPGQTYMMAHHGNFQRIAAALKHRTKLVVDVPPGLDNQKPMDAGIEIHAPYNLVEGQAVGLDPNLLAEIKASHLNTVARLENNDNIPEAGIGWALDQLKAEGVQTVIFAGEEILGFDGRLKATAEALRTRQMNVGFVEFVKIKGDTTLHALVPDRTILAHAIPSAEMATATPAENVQRFSLAARERNVRLLYIRLFLTKTDPLQENTRYLQRLKSTLLRAGLSVDPSRPVRPFEPLPHLVWLRVVLGFGIAAAFLLLLDQLCGLLEYPTGRVFWLAVLLALLLSLTAWVPLGTTLVRVAALAVACLFPSMALTLPHLFEARPWGESLWPTVRKRLFSVLGITALGMAIHIGLLAELRFLVKVEIFLGIKLALYLPLLLATLVWAFDLRATSVPEWLDKAKALGQRALALLENSVRVWQLLAGIAVLGVLALLWLRSGNEGTAVVSGLELRFRDLLDQYLLVRPRFKAALFAPFLIGLYLGARGQVRFALPCFLLGTIAVTDFYNTFCHLHTPLLVSAIRDVLGLVLGGGTGVLLIFLGEKWVSRARRTEDEPA